MDPSQQVAKSRRQWVISGAVALAFCAFVYFFVEWVDETVDLGYKEEARLNPMFAAQLYLESHGNEVESVSGLTLLDELPSTEDLIIMSGTRRALSDRRTNNLVRWVNDGGYLIVVADEEYDPDSGRNPDRILDAFGIYLHDCQWGNRDEDIEGNEEETDYDYDEDDELADDSADESGDENDDGVDDLDLPENFAELLRGTLSGELPKCAEYDFEKSTIQGDEDLDFTVEIDSCKGLVDESEITYEELESQGDHIIQRDIGSGIITASLSLDIFTNRRIHCADHAYFLQYMTAGRPKVWLLSDPDIPMIASLLWSGTPLACLSFGLWVVAWATSRSLGVGVEEPRKQPVRRELLEHLEASAHFLWRHDLLDDDIKAIRNETRQLARRHRQGFLSMSRSEQALILAELTQLSPSQIDFALHSDVPSNRREFTNMMQALQSIRRQL